MNGKGDKPRPIADRENYNSEFDRIFRKDIIKCQGCNGKGSELHACPYEVEILYNNNKYCNCCSECRDKCDDSI